MKQSKFGLSYEQLETLINQWILSERNRGIIKRKLLDDVSFYKLAEETNLSIRQTENIVHDGKEEIKKHI